MEAPKREEPAFVVCIDNTDYEASLERFKIYRTLPHNDPTAQNYLRVVDESGEDYLYPKAYFVEVELPQALKEVLSRAA
jgi:hypothetical protein